MEKPLLVFFTGAGVSEESGIPTFRTGPDGLWMNYNVMEVATAEAVENNLEKVLEFHNMLKNKFSTCEPNYCHKRIAELEKDYEVIVITSNVDNLHEKAGSTQVIHVHGSVYQACDINRDHTIDWTEDIKIGDMHPETGEQLRHNTVLFGEDLKIDIGMLGWRFVKESRLPIIVIGSSLSVYPSCNIVNYSNHVIHLNVDSVQNDDTTWTNINKKACEGIDEVIELIKTK